MALYEIEVNGQVYEVEADDPSQLDAVAAEIGGEPAAPAPAQAATAPQPTRGEALARGARMGGSLGFADEAMAGIGAGMDWMMSGGQQPFQQNYQSLRDAYRGEEEAVRSAHPGTYMLGEFGGGLATGTGIAGRAKTLKGMMGLGSAEGAAAGSGYAEDGVAGAAGIGGVAGGALAGIIPGGVAAVQALKRSLSRAPEAVVQREVGRLARQTGLSPEEIMQELRDMGPDAGLADVNPSTREALRGALSESDVPTQKDITQKYQARSDTRSGRLDEAISAEMGQGTAQGQRASLKAAREAESEGLYEQAFSHKPEITADDQKFLSGLRGRVPEAQKAGKKLARMEGKKWKDMTLSEQLHYSKLGLDDLIAKSGKKPQQRRALTQAKNELLGWMDDNIPAYGQARDIYAGSFAEERALDTGRNLFKGAYDGEEIANITKGMSAAEKESFGIGAKNALMNQLEVAGKLTKKQEAVAKQALGFEDFSRLRNTLAQEGRMAMTETAAGALRPGALDQERIAGRLIAGAGMGSPGVIAGGVLEEVYRSVRRLPPEAQAAVARKLSDPNITEQELRAIMREAKRYSPAAGALTLGTYAPMSGALQE